MAALNTATTPRTMTDLDVEASHEGAHHREVFLVLRCHAGHHHAAATVRTGRRRGRSVVWSTRAGRWRHACRPYSAPGRRPGRPPRPWGRSLAKGAACRNPARRAASSCFLRRSLRRFHRSRSRSTPVNSSRSRSISRSCSRMRESRGSCLVGGRCGGTTQLCHTPENCTSTNFWIWPDQEATPVNEYGQSCRGIRRAGRDSPGPARIAGLGRNGNRSRGRGGRPTGAVRGRSHGDVRDGDPRGRG